MTDGIPDTNPGPRCVALVSLRTAALWPQGIVNTLFMNRFEKAFLFGYTKSPDDWRPSLEWMNLQGLVRLWVSRPSKAHGLKNAYAYQGLRFLVKNATRRVLREQPD